jgi:hypothetical protein
MGDEALSWGIGRSRACDFYQNLPSLRLHLRAGYGIACDYQTYTGRALLLTVGESYPANQRLALLANSPRSAWRGLLSSRVPLSPNGFFLICQSCIRQPCALTALYLTTCVQ